MNLNLISLILNIWMKHLDRQWLSFSKISRQEIGTYPKVYNSLENT